MKKYDNCISLVVVLVSGYIRFFFMGKRTLNIGNGSGNNERVVARRIVIIKNSMKINKRLAAESSECALRFMKGRNFRWGVHRDGG